MRVLGVVQWAHRDKLGQPVAGVRPLFEIEKDEWRAIAAAEEYPTNGQIFWPNAQSASEGALIMFRAELNPGQKDEFKVAEPRHAYEVLDLRAIGTAAEVRASLASGIHLPAHSGPVKIAIWCAPDVLVGPVDLVPEAPGRWKLQGSNVHTLPTVAGAVIRTIQVDRHQRLIRLDDATASGYVDWDEDAHVLRRAVEVSARVAKLAGHDPGLTKRQITEAVSSLASQGLGANAKLELYRLERAMSLLEDSEEVTRRADALANMLQAHPAIKVALDDLRTQVRTTVEQDVRTQLQDALASERAVLAIVRDQHTQASAQLEAQRQEIDMQGRQLAALQAQALQRTSDAEAAIQARLLSAIDRPLDLLAEVSVLRPFLGLGQSGTERASTHTAASLCWTSKAGQAIKDRISLRRMLTAAARARGVDPAQMLQIHTAIATGLTPITIGSAGLAAMTAYAHAACGGRIQLVHVWPGVMSPSALYDASQAALLAAVEAAKDLDGLSLVVLEGANRSPLEASLLPVLQLAELGLSPLAEAPGLRLAATQVLGATTVPFPAQLWHHAVAVYPQRAVNSMPAAESGGDVSLSSELFERGDVPVEVIEALLEQWPECRALQHELARFGAVVARFHESTRVADELLHGLILPYVATALSEEEQLQALNTAGDSAGILGPALGHLRRWLR